MSGDKPHYSFAKDTNSYDHDYIAMAISHWCQALCQHVQATRLVEQINSRLNLCKGLDTLLYYFIPNEFESLRRYFRENTH